VDSVQIQVGRRARIWLAEQQVGELAKRGGGPETGNRIPPRGPSPAVQPGPEEKRDLAAVADERDRWRSEALRLREAGLLMAAAFDAYKEADQHRADAYGHISSARVSMDKAFEETRKAADYQNQALRQFMTPTDVLEN
jgi:hypothetical protein